MAFAPATIVEAPTYGQRRYGLFSQLALRPEGDGRWLNGFSWETACGAADVLIPDCDPAEAIGFPKEPNTSTSYPESLTPFTVYGYHRCSPVDRDTERSNALAAASLQRQEEKAVEAALWAALAPDLTAPPIPSPTPFNTSDLSVVFGYLEDVNDLAYSSGGMILVSRRMGQWALDEGAVRHLTASTIGTQLGTPVVSGNFPVAEAVGGGTVIPNGEFIALIGPLAGYRSQIFYPSNRAGDLLDRGTNDMNAVAERSYSLGVEPPCTDPETTALGYVFDITYEG